jgi:hypothetical protein
MFRLSNHTGRQNEHDGRHSPSSMSNKFADDQTGIDGGWNGDLSPFADPSESERDNPEGSIPMKDCTAASLPPVLNSHSSSPEPSDSINTALKNGTQV